MTKFVPRPSIIHFVGLVRNVDHTILNFPLEDGFRFEKLEPKLLRAILESQTHSTGARKETIPDLLFWHDSQRDIFCVRRDYPDFGPHFYPKTSQRVEKLKLDITLSLIRLSTNIPIYMEGEYHVASLDNEFMVSGQTYKPSPIGKDKDTVSISIDDIKRSKDIINQVLLKSLAKNDLQREQKLKTMLENPFFNSVCDLAFQNFQLSYTVQNTGLAFLTLITTLEVLFGSGAHRVARNAAVLLGRNRDEAKFIFDRILVLHEKRSKYLHSGKIHEITPNDLLECRKYSSECIVAYFKMNQPREKLLEALNTLGFGDGPARSL